MMISSHLQDDSEARPSVRLWIIKRVKLAFSHLFERWHAQIRLIDDTPSLSSSPKGLRTRSRGLLGKAARAAAMMRRVSDAYYGTGGETNELRNCQSNFRWHTWKPVLIVSKSWSWAGRQILGGSQGLLQDEVAGAEALVWTHYLIRKHNYNWDESRDECW